MPTQPAAFPNRPSATVTAAEIRAAIKGDSSHCMIADALRREYPTATRILVDVRTVRMTDPIRRKRYTWLTPYEAARFLVRWDQGIEPPEFAVRLRTPIAITQAGNTGGNGSPRTGSNKVERSTRDGTIIGGKDLPTGALSASATPRAKPPAASRTRGYGIHALKEIE